MPPESSLRSLERRLGPFDAAAIVISNVIGVGIFITPRIIAQAVPHPIEFLGVWLIGGLLAFAGAMAYAELGTLRPRSGGEYVYLREGFGPLAAFLTGWTSFVAGFAGAMAAGALGIADYLGRFVPVANDPTPFFSIPLPWVPLEFSPRTLVALTPIIGLALIHMRGLGPGRVVQNALAVLKVGALALVVALGLGFGRGSFANLSASPEGVSTNLALAFIVVMFSYSGWNAASYVAEEIRDPGRNVPIALALGTGAVVVLYLGLNVFYLYAVPISEIASEAQSELAMVAADRSLGPLAARMLGGLAVVVLIGSLSAMTLAGPRVYFAMARDGAFFPVMARVHPRYHTPSVAIAAQTVWASLLVLTNTKDALAEYTGFAVLLFSAFAVSTLFILRRRYPDEPRPFKAWGYPVAPAAFVVASLFIMVAAVAGRPGPSLFGAAIIAAGIPLYLILRRTGTGDRGEGLPGR
ncbi:MAG TPA: amino acid permease [Vicinamibacterales bacterium]|nr:amino acid permease [Vicinamibacterales bacterium]